MGQLGIVSWCSQRFCRCSQAERQPLWSGSGCQWWLTRGGRRWSEWESAARRGKRRAVQVEGAELQRPKCVCVGGGEGGEGGCVPETSQKGRAGHGCERHRRSAWAARLVGRRSTCTLNATEKNLDFSPVGKLGLEGEGPDRTEPDRGLFCRDPHGPLTV